MENIVASFAELMAQVVMAVIGALVNNWPTLSLAILTVAVLRAYISPEKLKHKLLLKPKVSILGSVAFGAFTPLCAGGTLGLIVGLLTTVLPWGPIMAFLTSSPLMSPDGFIMVAGVINLNFAIALAIASIIIGLASGLATHVIETKTDFLKNQTRFSENSTVQSCGCSSSAQSASNSCLSSLQTASQETCCSSSRELTVYSLNSSVLRLLMKVKWREIGEHLINIGVKNMLFYFSIFVAVGFLINRFIPTSIIAGLLGAENATAVPLAALIGLPLYITTEASIPLIKALMAQGASAGAMLAFWITGQTTSAWILVGLSSFMKRRAVGLYIFFIMIGGLLSGYIYDLILSLGILK